MAFDFNTLSSLFLLCGFVVIMSSLHRAKLRGRALQERLMAWQAKIEHQQADLAKATQEALRAMADRMNTLSTDTATAIKLYGILLAIDVALAVEDNPESMQYVHPTEALIEAQALLAKARTDFAGHPVAIVRGAAILELWTAYEKKGLQ